MKKVKTALHVNIHVHTHTARSLNVSESRLFSRTTLPVCFIRCIFDDVYHTLWPASLPHCRYARMFIEEKEKVEHNFSSLTLWKISATSHFRFFLKADAFRTSMAVIFPFYHSALKALGWRCSSFILRRSVNAFRKRKELKRLGETITEREKCFVNGNIRNILSCFFFQTLVSRSSIESGALGPCCRRRGEVPLHRQKKTPARGLCYNRRRKAGVACLSPSNTSRRLETTLTVSTYFQLLRRELWLDRSAIKNFKSTWTSNR